MRLVSMALLIVSAVAGCQKAPEESRRSSDATDYFYYEKGVEGTVYPEIRWHRREPGRLFDTTLRPTDMQGSFPTSYLSRITRNDQAYSKRIYDIAYINFHLPDTSPISPQTSDRLGSTVSENEVRLEIGGWSQSDGTHPRWLSQIYRGHMETRGHDIFVEDRGLSFHHFTVPEASDVDGRPVVVECMKVVGCQANLTIPQEMAGLPPMREGELPGRSIGARLAIAFHSDHIGDWPEIRRKAVCFAVFSIPKLDAERIAPIKRLRCNDVRGAIAKTISRA